MLHKETVLLSQVRWSFNLERFRNTAVVLLLLQGTLPRPFLTSVCLFSKDSSTGDFHPKPPRQVLQAANYQQILLVSKSYLNNCDSSPFLVLPNVNMEIRLFPSPLWGTFMRYWQDVITSFIHLP